MGSGTETSQFLRLFLPTFTMEVVHDTGAQAAQWVKPSLLIQRAEFNPRSRRNLLSRRSSDSSVG